jgi:hypothetical protein
MFMRLKEILKPSGWNFLLMTSILTAAAPFGKVASFLRPYMGIPIPFFNLDTFSFLSSPEIGILTFIVNAVSLYILITVSIFIIRRRLDSKGKLSKKVPKFQERYYYFLMFIGFVGLLLILYISYLKSKGLLDISDSVIFLIFITPTILSLVSTLHGYIKTRKK